MCGLLIRVHLSIGKRKGRLRQRDQRFFFRFEFEWTSFCFFFNLFSFSTRCCVATVEKRALAHRVDGGGSGLWALFSRPGTCESRAVLVGAIAVEMQ